MVATRIGGRLRHGTEASRGGFLDQLYFLRWDASFEVGAIETEDDALAEAPDADLLRLMMVASRRMTELAEVRSGLAVGWHERSRAWWSDGGGQAGTLLSMSTCEQNGLLKGEASGFLDLFEAIAGPAQVVVAQEEPLAPCARVLIEQLTRTAQDDAAIAEDMTRTFGAGSQVPDPSDWLFVGALAAALRRRPLLEELPVLSRDGLGLAPPPAAILTSINAEFRDVARHRRLGYTLACHDFRLVQSGPGVAGWLRANFVRVRRAPDDIRQDYLHLLSLLKNTTGARLIVINAASTPIHEDVSHYAAFPAPLNETLAGVRAKELNLMLHDLARDHPLDILDLDAAVARVGVRDHMADGMQWSGRLKAELRGELIDILQKRAIPGCVRR